MKCRHFAYPGKNSLANVVFPAPFAPAMIYTFGGFMLNEIRYACKALILLAMMKSFSCSPAMECVHSTHSA